MADSSPALAKPVRDAGWHKVEMAWLRLQKVVADADLDCPLDDVEDLFDPAVDMVAGIETWGDDEFEKGRTASGPFTFRLVDHTGPSE